MFEQSTHSMELERTYSSGAEEWYCPTCGRRMIMQWPPKYKKIVLEPGDEQAAHSGGKGGLQMGATQIAPAEDSLAPEEPYSGFARPLDDTTPDTGDSPAHDDLRPWLRLFEGDEFNN
jgi:hypothetical protein